MKIRIIKRAHIILFLVTLSSSLFSQEEFSKVTQDFESWNSIRLKTKFNKKFSASLEQGLRLSQDASQLDQALSELEVTYKVIKALELSFGSRYIYDRTKSNNFENNFRYHLDATIKQDLKRFDFSARLRYQNKSELAIGVTDVDDPSSYLRLKLEAGYNIRKWKFDPEFSTEIFRSLESGGSIDKIRFTVGTDYSFKKAGQLGFFYRLEQEVNTSLPKTTYITGLKYTYTIKPFKK